MPPYLPAGGCDVWAGSNPMQPNATHACSDTCYFTAGSDKAACDQAFLDALLAECESSLK